MFQSKPSLFNELPFSVQKRRQRLSNISITEGLNYDSFNCIGCFLACLVLELSRCDFGVTNSKLVDKLTVRLKGRRSTKKQTWKMLIDQICCVSIGNTGSRTHTNLSTL